MGNDASIPGVPSNGRSASTMKSKLTAGGLLLSFLGALLMKLKAVFGR